MTNDLADNAKVQFVICIIRRIAIVVVVGWAMRICLRGSTYANFGGKFHLCEFWREIQGGSFVGLKRKTEYVLVYLAVCIFMFICLCVCVYVRACLLPGVYT